MQNIYQDLCRLTAKENVRRDEPMQRHTTFRIGGPAAFYVTPEESQEVAGVIRFCRDNELPYYILGNGSNLLVSDSGFDGVVIAIDKLWSYTRWEGHRVTAGAGTPLALIARQALEHGQAGMEFAAGIPGTLGGAVVMNAGAYGSEMKDIILSATVLTIAGEVKELSAGELALGYRTSCIPANQYVVLEAELELRDGDPEQIRSRMDDLSMQRRTKQPLEYPSAGSTFKRPQGYFAGKLIQDAGLKGYQAGGAQVSEKHSGFVINKGNATAGDVIELCDHVKAEVKKQFGVDLELEVKLLGKF